MKCHDPSGCIEAGQWRIYRRHGSERPSRVYLCNKHWAQWLRQIVGPLRSEQISDSIAAHPASFDSIGGRVSLTIWFEHPAPCTCRHCNYVNAHLDAGVDA